MATPKELGFDSRHSSEFQLWLAWGVVAIVVALVTWACHTYVATEGWAYAIPIVVTFLLAAASAIYTMAPHGAEVWNHTTGFLLETALIMSLFALTVSWLCVIPVLAFGVLVGCYLYINIAEADKVKLPTGFYLANAAMVMLMVILHVWLLPTG